MIITVECPECHTTFPVDPRKVPDGGVKVRCSACSGIFFVEKPEMPAPVATPPVPVPSVGGAGAEDETVPRASASDPAAPSEPEATEPPAEDEGDNVDPWSGADWDDPAETGAPQPDPADPWSGGMGLHDHETVTDESDEDAGWSTDEAVTDESDEDAGWSIDEADIDDIDEADIDETPAGWEDALIDDPSAPAEPTPEPAAAGPAHADWVVEQSSPVEFEEPEAPVERLETIEEQTRSAAEAHDAGLGHDDDPGEWDDAAVPPAAEAPVGGDESGASAAMAEAVEEAAGATEAAPTGFQFGKRDPHEKARRLARVLVSDMITYNPERHQRALEQGTLHADFEEEIRKSWAEYTDQVGRELAESTSYWFDALNEILARGEKVF